MFRKEYWGGKVLFNKLQTNATFKRFLEFFLLANLALKQWNSTRGLSKLPRGPQDDLKWLKIKQNKFWNKLKQLKIKMFLILYSPPNFWNSKKWIKFILIIAIVVTYLNLSILLWTVGALDSRSQYTIIRLISLNSVKTLLLFENSDQPNTATVTQPLAWV